MQYRKDIQGLRALAVLFVFVFHLNPRRLSGGFIGVDIFFVISGFLVGSIILKKLNEGTFSFVDFYIARARRIIPAYYFMLLCTVAATVTLLIGYEVDTFRRVVKHAIIFNSDYGFATMNSYFGVGLRQNPLLHTWTIATEMKFYFLLPLLLFFTRKKYVSTVLIVISVILLCYSVYEIQFSHHRSVAYYSLLIRVPEFLIGVFIALYIKRLSALPSSVKVIAGFLGMILLFLCAIFFTSKTPFPGVMALLPCVGAALLIIADKGPISALLSQKPFVAVGTVSYSVYLWHWPVMALVRYYHDTYVLTRPQIVMVVVLTALFSIISYFFVENYFRSKKLKPLFFAVVPALLLLIAVYTYARPVNDYFSNIPAVYSRPLFGAKSHNTDFVETFGDTLAAGPKIFLTGNSHALSLKAYFDYIGKRQHFSFRTVTCNTFTPLEGLDAHEAMKKRYGDFMVARQLMPTAKKEMADAEIIIIVSSTWDYIGSFKPAIKKLILGLDKEQKLILLGTFPMLDKNPLRINRDFIKDHTVEQHYKVNFKPRDEEIMALVKKYPNVYYFDISKGPAYDSAPYYNDTVMYYDRKHLNKFGAVSLAKETEAQFMQLLDSIK